MSDRSEATRSEVGAAPYTEGGAGPRPTGNGSGSVLDTLRGAKGLRIGLGLILLIPVAVLVVRPLIDLFGEAIGGGGSGIGRLASVPNIGSTIWNTVYLAVGSTVLAVVLGVILAWCSVRVPPRMRGFVAIIPMLPLIVPTVAFVIGWSFLLSPSVGYLNQLLRKLWFGGTTGPLNIYSIWGVVILTGLSLVGFVYVFVYAALRGISSDYEAAALTSGASSIRAFFTIILPLLRPSIVYSTGIVLLLALGQFTAPLLLGSRAGGLRVLTTEIYYLTERYPVDYALGAAIGLPVLVAGLIVAVSQRHLLRHSARFQTATGRGQRVQTASSKLALIPIGLFFAVAVALPLLALLHVALSRYWTGSLDFDRLSFASFRAVFAQAETFAAIRNSLVYSAIAVVIAAPIGFLLALATLSSSKLPRIIRTPIEFISLMPLAVPAALLGFAFLFAYSKPPLILYGRGELLVIAYLTLMLPYALRASSSELMAQGAAFAEAGRISGSTAFGVICRILLPLARTGIVSGIAVMFIILSHELAVSSMVATPQTEVMGTALYDLWSRGTYPLVAAMSLVMVVVTGLGVACALALGGRRAFNAL